MAKAKQSDLDAWGDHVEEYSKRQKQLHQELVNRKLMEMKNTTMTENKQTAVESLREALDTELKAGTKMVVNWDMYLKMEEDQTRDFTIHNLKRQKQHHQDLINKHLMEQELKNTMTEKTNMTDDNTNNTIQTQPDLIWTERKPENTTTWSENKRWLVAVIGLLCVVGFVSALIIYNLIWMALVGVFGMWLLGGLLMASKYIVDELVD
jgi:hypothetical protein